MFCPAPAPAPAPIKIIGGCGCSKNIYLYLAFNSLISMILENFKELIQKSLINLGSGIYFGY
jgi:hypothetical protein